MKKRQPSILIGLGLFTLIFVVYLIFLCPSIHPRDNPDILTGAITLGIPHSPGYPLFTILGYLFSKIPLGTLPWRVNLMSALFSALSIMVLYFLTLKLTKKIWPSLIGAGILAFSYYFFLQSLFADVLSLNNLLVGLELLTLLCWYEKRQPIRLRSGLSRVQIEGQSTHSTSLRVVPSVNRGTKYLYLFAFLFGLAFSNHQISFILLPAFIYLIYATDKKIFLNWKLLFKLLGFFLLGLLPYIYLPIRAAQNPAYMWGNPDTFSGFLYMISRKEYTGDNFQFISYFAWRIWDWFKLISGKEFLLVGLGLGILGLADFFKRDKKIAIFILLLIILAGPVFAFFSDTPSQWIEAIGMERFFIFSYFIFALAIALGINYILEKYPKINYVLIFIPLGFFLLNFRQVNLRQYFYAADLGQNILKSLPQNAVLFAGSDVPLFELQYLQKVESLRTDVVILPGADPKLVGLSASTTKRLVKKFPDYNLPIEELAKKYPVYTTNNIDIFWGGQTNSFIPEGLVYRYSSDPKWRENFDGLNALKNLKDSQARGEYKIAQIPEQYTREIVYYYVNGWTSLGEAYQKRKMPADAAFCYEKALEMDPDYLVALNNYAGTFLERGQYQEAADRFKAILKKYPGQPSAQNGLMIAQQKLTQSNQ